MFCTDYGFISSHNSSPSHESRQLFRQLFIFLIYVVPSSFNLFQVFGYQISRGSGGGCCSFLCARFCWWRIQSDRLPCQRGCCLRAVWRLPQGLTVNSCQFKQVLFDNLFKVFCRSVFYGSVLLPHQKRKKRSHGILKISSVAQSTLKHFP